MRKLVRSVLTLGLYCLSPWFLHSYGQGSLTPPPGPPSPTMKTLARIEPPIPIAALPYNIQAPGSCYVTGNLTGPAGSHGITIAAGDVSLDLGGFVVVGGPAALNGVEISSSPENIRVQNGALHGWALGIDAHDAINCRFENLRLSGNPAQGLSAGVGSIVTGCIASSNQGVGLSVGDFGVVAECIARGNGRHGITGGTGARITGCNGAANFGHGILAGNNSLIESCVTVNNSGVGTAGGDDAQVRSCKASNKGGMGFFLGVNFVINSSSASGNLEVGVSLGGNSQSSECSAVANTKGLGVGSASVVRGCSALQKGEDGITVTNQCSAIGNLVMGNFLARDAAGIRVTGKTV